MARKEDQSKSLTRGAPPARHSHTILVIDDEELIRSSCSGILGRAGFSVRTAADGREGLSLFEEIAGDTRCVLLDLSMPYVRGNVVFARIRAINPEVPVIIMSGFCDEQTMREFSAAGVAGFVHKPFQPERLVRAVQEAQVPKVPAAINS